ncbi:MAG: ABC transporter permease subunit, partial [Anaerolineales bacterium]|nr:ABC transporter permease subunit [Anaerolineales bacterium]
ALTGQEQLYFYDAIAPIVRLESINQEIVYRASRFGAYRSQAASNQAATELRLRDDRADSSVTTELLVPGTELLFRGDYLNCPLTHGEYERLVEALINLPVIIPHTAAGIALLLVFGRQGVLGQWLTPLGLTFTDNLGGIVVGMLFVSLPYLVNMNREAFALVDEELERVALIDGASAWQAFRHVSLPLAWRGVLAGAVMMWARGISEFGAIVILAYNPKIVPVLVYERFNGFGLGAAQPVAALLIVVAIIVFILVQLFLIPGRKSS